LLILGYALVVAVLVLVVVGVTGVHLQRNRLVAVADLAALDAADSLDEAHYYAGGLGADGTGGACGPGPGSARALPLSTTTVRAGVAAFLDRSPAAERLSRLRIAPGTGTPDGCTAQVRLTALARLPVVSSVTARWSAGVPLEVTSRARARPEP
jgi:hypothetical protein